ncbi:hypothetical protein ACFQ2B_40695 [Streptomyces stramineus]
MHWTPTTLVLIDEATDRDRASDGRSRYGVYLRQQEPKRWFMDEIEARDPAAFARFAWTAGTGPVMSPAYAVVRPDLDIRLTRAEEDGSLLVLIDVRLHHDALDKKHRPPTRSPRGRPSTAATTTPRALSRRTNRRLRCCSPRRCASLPPSGTCGSRRESWKARLLPTTPRVL